MAAPVNVQNDWISASAVSSIGLTLLSVAAGNLLIGVVNQQSASSKTYSFSDDKGNTWAEAVRITGANASTLNRVLEIEYAKNVAAGNTAITSTINSGTGTWEMTCQEVSGADTAAPLDVTGTHDETVSSTNHHCADSGSIDTAADVLVMAIGTLNSASTLTKHTSYTRIGNTGSGVNMVQYRSSDAALTDEQSTWTSSANRIELGVSASFKAAAAAAGQPTMRRWQTVPHMGGVKRFAQRGTW